MAYFSNGCEGEKLEVQCADCPLGLDLSAPCPVVMIQMLYNYDQLAKGQEKLREAMSSLVADDGVCQVRKLLREAIP